MTLDYLIFDWNDEEGGGCSLDAMASVLPDRLPALLREVQAVLGWACRTFGAPSAGLEGGEWDYALEAVDEQGVLLDRACDLGPASVSMQHVTGRVDLALTLSGTAAFGAAFRDAFTDQAA